MSQSCSTPQWSEDTIIQLPGSLACTKIFDGDFSNRVTIITDYINVCLNIMMTVKTKKNPNSKPWITLEIKQSLKEKQGALRHVNIYTVHQHQLAQKCSPLNWSSVPASCNLIQNAATNNNNPKSGYRIEKFKKADCASLVINCVSDVCRWLQGRKSSFHAARRVAMNGAEQEEKSKQQVVS